VPATFGNRLGSPLSTRRVRLYRNHRADLSLPRPNSCLNVTGFTQSTSPSAFHSTGCHRAMPSPPASLFRFMTAFRSRSCSVRQPAQVHKQTARGKTGAFAAKMARLAQADKPVRNHQPLTPTSLSRWRACGQAGSGTQQSHIVYGAPDASSSSSPVPFRFSTTTEEKSRAREVSSPAQTYQSFPDRKPCHLKPITTD
jgi:hypothetical protein